MQMTSKSKSGASPPFDWADPFGLDEQLTDEERMVRDTAEAYAQERLLPRVTQAYLDERFEREIMNEMGRSA
jgi:glutaryl-CoA dehydrogenase